MITRTRGKRKRNQVVFFRCSDSDGVFEIIEARPDCPHPVGDPVTKKNYKPPAV